MTPSCVCRPKGALHVTDLTKQKASVIEGNLQSGNAVAHVIDTLITPPGLIIAEDDPGSDAAVQRRQYASPMQALDDPALNCSRFAAFVREAGMEGVLGDGRVEMTVFAPSDRVSD
jgi:hypothetical protein